MIGSELPLGSKLDQFFSAGRIHNSIKLLSTRPVPLTVSGPPPLRAYGASLDFLARGRTLRLSGLSRFCVPLQEANKERFGSRQTAALTNSKANSFLSTFESLEHGGVYVALLYDCRGIRQFDRDTACGRRY